MVSVGTSIVPPGSRPPPADTPGLSIVVTTPQVTASIHDFAASLGAQRHPGGERDPWGRPLDDTTVLILRTWTYAGPAPTSKTPGAELALAAADRARAHHDQPGPD